MTVVDLFAPPRIAADRRDGGTILLRSTEELGEHAPTMAHSFRAHAEQHPERLLAAERDGDSWLTLTWGQARPAADALAQALLDAGLGPERPLMVLSGNALAHLKLTLAAYTAGVPVLPISPAYSLLSVDHERVRSIADLCGPGMAFAEDGEAFGPSLAALSGRAAEEPSSIDAGEITDKGYLNQRCVLERRTDLVDRLFAEPIDERVITPRSA